MATSRHEDAPHGAARVLTSCGWSASCWWSRRSLLRRRSASMPALRPDAVLRLLHHPVEPHRRRRVVPRARRARRRTLAWAGAAARCRGGLYLRHVHRRHRAALERGRRPAAPAWVDVVLHKVFPVIVVADWLLDPPRQRLDIRDTLLARLPADRGAVPRSPRCGHGWYPYPFLDPANGGYAACGRRRRRARRLPGAECPVRRARERTRRPPPALQHA